MPKHPISVAVIVFDFDGVLVNTGKDIANAANFALRNLGIAPLPDNEIVRFIGGGAEPLVKKCLDLYNATELFEPALQLFRDYYSKHATDEAQLYPGVKEMLLGCAAKGIKMGIATNKEEKITQELLKKLEIAAFFEVIVGPSTVKRRKPDPEAIEMILHHFSLAPQYALMVGDKQEDILAGKAAGTFTCGVTYGYGSPEEISNAKPDFIIDEAIDLLELLN
ncbi:MAG: HAD-IIIA family hydrolase [Candidatus Methanomethyliaceae archaeon]